MKKLILVLYVGMYTILGYTSHSAAQDIAKEPPLSAAHIAPGGADDQASSVHPTNIFTAAGLPGVIVVSLSNSDSDSPSRAQYTLDGGTTWSLAHPDTANHSLVGIVPRNDPQNPVRLLALDGRNLMRSGDWGQTWANAANGFLTEFALSPKDPQRMFGSSYAWTLPFDQLEGWIDTSADGGVIWSRQVRKRYAVIDRVTPSPVAALDGFYQHGGSWYRFGSDERLTFPDLINSITLDGVDAGRIYGMTSTLDAGQTSPDGGHTWIPWATIPPAACSQLMAHPTQTNTLFLRCEAGLYRSVNGGNAWTQITQTAGDALAPNLGVPGQLLWSHSGCLWASTDSGTSWARVSCFNPYPNSYFLPIVIR